jgi:hypothetical protein
MSSLQASAITYMGMFQFDGKQYIMTGGMNGILRMYDTDLRLLWWCDLKKILDCDYFGSIICLNFIDNSILIQILI